MAGFTRAGFLLEQEKGCRKYGLFSRPFDAFERKTGLALRVPLQSLA